MAVTLLLTLMMRVFRRVRPTRDEMGVSLVEYALLLLLIVVVALVAIVALGNTTANSLNTSGNAIFNP